MSTSLWSDLELARARLPRATDEQRVRLLIRELLSEWALTPPVDLELVASLRAIASVDYVDLPWAACLVHDSGGTQVKVRASDLPRRQRFSLAHEIGHTFLPGYALATQYRCDPPPTGRQQRNTVEHLSDIAASELLMPVTAVEQALVERGCTMDAAIETADACDASLEAAARRIVDVNGDAVLLCLERTPAPRRPQDEPRLRLRYAYARGDWPYLPPAKSLGDNHPLQHCLEGEIVDALTTLSDLTPRASATVRVSGRYAPWRDANGELHHRVLALAAQV